MKTADEGVSCEVCGKQRAPGLIHSRPSRIMPGQNLIKCDVCESAGMEPRWLIKIVAKTRGLKFVSDYLENKLYPGAEITAKEVVRQIPQKS